MPTYQYACTATDCGHRFELVQSFTDPAASECPVCGQRVRKVYGSVGVVFKGSGFYRTDSRAGNGAGEGKGRSDAESGGTAAKSGSESGSGTKEAAPSAASGSKTDSVKTPSGGSGSSGGSGGSGSSGGTKAAASA